MFLVWHIMLLQQFSHNSNAMQCVFFTYEFVRNLDCVLMWSEYIVLSRYVSSWFELYSTCRLTAQQPSYRIHNSLTELCVNILYLTSQLCWHSYFSKRPLFFSPVSYVETHTLVNTLCLKSSQLCLHSHFCVRLRNRWIEQRNATICWCRSAPYWTVEWPW